MNDQEIKDWMLSVLDKVIKTQEKNMSLFQSNLENFEKQLAYLTKAYAEMAVMIQSILSMNLNEDNQDLFNEAFEKNTKLMMEAFQDGIRSAQSESSGFHAESSAPESDT